MTPFRLATPSRLHFGLLSWGKKTGRQFGGVGLMVQRPGLVVRAELAEEWSVEGPLSQRALGIARRVASHLESLGRSVRPLRLEVVSSPPEHAGLGTGTQLSLAIARCVATGAGLSAAEAPGGVLAGWTGRGVRSGVGLHGFDGGELIVDGGHRPGSERAIPPMLCRQSFPKNWSVLMVIPTLATGLSGDQEVEAFSSLPPFSEALVDKLCRLVLLDILPATAESDLEGFGAALDELQMRVGSAFAPAQGGIYAHPALSNLVTWLRHAGLQGVGQSSWGPTLYGFLETDTEREAAILEGFHKEFRSPAATIFWTKADDNGAQLIAEPKSR